MAQAVFVYKILLLFSLKLTIGKSCLLKGILLKLIEDTRVRIVLERDESCSVQRSLQANIIVLAHHFERVLSSRVQAMGRVDGSAQGIVNLNTLIQLIGQWTTYNPRRVK